MIQHELAFDDYLTILRRRWLLICVLAILGTAAAYAVSRFLPNEFTSKSAVLAEEPTVPANFVAPVANNNIAATLKLMEQQVLSRERLEPLIRQYGLYSEDVNRIPTELLVNRLEQSIEVSFMKAPSDDSPPPGFTVSVTNGKPQTAQAICAAVTSMFLEENVRRRQEQSDSTTRFLTQQIVDAKEKLDEQDSKLAEFQTAHPGALPSDEQSNLAILAGLNSEMGAITGDINRAQQDKSLAEAILQQQIASQQTAETGKNPQTLEEQLASLQTQLANLQSRYTDRYPDVVKTKSEIAELQKKVVEADNADVDQTEKIKPIEPVQIIQLRAQIRSDNQLIIDKGKQQQGLQERVTAIQRNIQGTPLVDAEFKRLTRDHEAALDFYNSLLRRQSDSTMASDLERRQESEQLSLFSPASLPASPSFPNRPLFAGGGFGGGLVVGLGLAFLLEMRDRSLRTERDVEAHLRLPVIAMIPSIELVSGHTSPKESIRPISSDSELTLGART